MNIFEHVIYPRYWLHGNPEKYYHCPLYKWANTSSEVKEFAQRTEPVSVRADIHTHDAKACVLLITLRYFHRAQRQRPWGSAQKVAAVTPFPRATAPCLYSHLLWAGWSKRKPFPGRHPAPAAVCESKEDKTVTCFGVYFQVELGKITDDSERGNPTSKLFLTSDWHFSSGC